jgi:hypothetical protein
MPDMQTDIEVLKTEVRGLQSGISELAAKIDIIISMQVQLVRLQEQHDSQRQAMDRAFTTIREHKEHISGFQQIVSHIKGGALVATVLLGFLNWYLFDQINTLKRVDVDVKAVDRRVTIIESRIWPDVPGGSK